MDRASVTDHTTQSYTFQPRCGQYLDNLDGRIFHCFALEINVTGPESLSVSVTCFRIFSEGTGLMLTFAKQKQTDGTVNQESKQR